MRVRRSFKTFAMTSPEQVLGDSALEADNLFSRCLTRARGLSRSGIFQNLGCGSRPPAALVRGTLVDLFSSAACGEGGFESVAGCPLADELQCSSAICC